MYEDFFGFSDRPFAAAPNVDRYFPAASIDAARELLTRTIERAEGPAVVIGPVGTGKTLLCRLLARRFADAFRVACLTSGRIGSPRALSQAILFELGLPYRHMDEGELRLSLIEHLAPSERFPRGMLLLVDEAHTMSSRLLEEIRVLTNLVHDGQPRVHVVLAGGPRLDERLAGPRMEAFNQRITARCYLEPMNRAETADYVRAQVAAVANPSPGTDRPAPFTDDALEAVHRATDGIARLVNQVCDHALLLALADDRPTIDAAGIEEAWADLQQLPAPSSVGNECRGPRADGVVEFGGLDDDIAGVVASVPFRRRQESHVAAYGDQRDETNRDASADEGLLVEDGRLAVDLLGRPAADFQPTGTIGPEIELRFDPAENPFAESFVDEEVILDRYAALDGALRHLRPRVYGPQSRELAAFASAFTVEQVGAVETNAVKTTTVEANAAQADAVAAVAPEDELIVVEDDDPRSVRKSAPRPQDRVRRQEYRQLFARLRRGTG